MSSPFVQLLWMNDEAVPFTSMQVAVPQATADMNPTGVGSAPRPIVLGPKGLVIRFWMQADPLAYQSLINTDVNVKVQLLDQVLVPEFPLHMVSTLPGRYCLYASHEVMTPWVTAS